MNKEPIVLVHADNAAILHDALSGLHPDLELHTCDSYAGLPEKLQQTNPDVVYSVRFAGTLDFPRQALLNCESLTWLSVGGSGTDHLNPWNPGKLTVTNSAGVAADMMSQYVLGIMLSFNLNLRDFALHQKNREWISGSVKPLDNCTVLIIGLGHTGKAVAAQAKKMGMTTLGVRAHPTVTPDVDETLSTDALPELWSRADFIAVCVPLLESTKGLVNDSAFKRMNKSAVLIDISRGGVVNETALLAALDTEAIRGAALDVFTEEPLPSHHRLWSHENVIITPHCSSVYEGWEIKSIQMFAENLHRYRIGETLLNIVEPTQGY